MAFLCKGGVPLRCHPLRCHPERSEGSLIISGHERAENGQRSFASLRMTIEIRAHASVAILSLTAASFPRRASVFPAPPSVSSRLPARHRIPVSSRPSAICRTSRRYAASVPPDATAGRARKFVRLVRELHHHRRNFAELERAEHFLAARAGGVRVSVSPRMNIERRLHVLDVSDRRTRLEIFLLFKRRRL